MTDEVNTLIFTKGAEKYFFVWDDESYPTLLERLGVYARSEELSLEWQDAVLVAKKIREHRANEPRARTT